MPLYPYQERVRAHLLAGENVLLQAPTGAGKTRAALYPYLETLEGVDERASWPQTQLPLTCRYAVPMRVLATQFEREYTEYFKRMEQKRGTRFADRYTHRLGIPIPAIQTGEAPEDPKFESPLTFCTIDQLLASFIGTPYSIGMRQANLNVGAVTGSYLVLDEFHLYPLEKGGNGARMTALAMLRLLKGLSPFVLMTATFSTRLLERLAHLLDAHVVRVDDAQELQEIMQERTRTIRQVDAPMTPEAILCAHEEARERGAGASLVVCNTVGRAQEMYLQLRHALEQAGRSNVRLMLLHSRFTPQDRQRKSSTLEQWLGKDQWRNGFFLGEDAIVVGTQVVEVGLNISAGVLHTELAPASSLIQRAGRCARFEKQQGEVIVYPLPLHEDGKPSSFLPYDAQLCEATWGHLAGCSIRSRILKEEEQALVDAVHTEEDEQMLNRFEREEGQIKRTVMEVLATHEAGKEGALIRNVRQVAVLVHAEPEKAITTNPFAWESFSLSPGTLIGARDALERRRQSLGLEAPDWTMKRLVTDDPAGKQEEDSRREPVYRWDSITNVNQIRSALRIALPPELATYDDELGFRLLLDERQQTTGWQSSPAKTSGPAGSGGPRSAGDDRKRRRSYVEHISGLVHAYEWSVRRELAWVAGKLEQALSLPAGRIDQAVRLAIACHDLGKLSVGWQRWARDWQELLAKERGPMYRVSGQVLLAKTDGLAAWEEEQLLKKQLRVKRPPLHACAGVMASVMFIAQRLAAGLTGEQKEGGRELTRATLNAIARHHAPTATAYEAVEWDQREVLPVIEQALSACRLPPDLAGLGLSALQAGDVPGSCLIKPGYETRTQLFATWLGFVIVRALRLCDQRAETEW